ncbi:GGDEF domain-containing protein [Chitinibacter fontanus]|uniref:diguanylate cyclase n=1 Tax=Chitinibacter fontanus TaxID=1737446 RepID=A0A7D5Z223_9NEIS|nr:GGDEF domain-containing protein [Chitinibacter fontanus]QLI80961.1 GGDEF domain-containing protein [Chitinibacter fontanus]
MDAIAIISALSISLTGLSSWQFAADRSQLSTQRAAWLLSCLCVALGLLLEGVLVPDADWPNWLGTHLIFWGLVLQIWALTAFSSRAVPRYFWPLILAALALHFILLLGISEFEPNSLLFGIVTAVYFCALFSLIAVWYWWVEAELGSRWPTLFSILYACAALMFLARIVLQALHLPADSVWVDAVEMGLYILASTANIYGGFGFLLIVLRLKNRQLARQAQLDGLTGALNRRGLELLLQRLSSPSLANASLSVVMLDLDYFKQVNDRMGHAAGDEILIKLVAFLQQHLREADVVARYGGEEFCLILPQTTLADAAARVEQIRAGFAQLACLDEAPVYRCTFSAGVACRAQLNQEITEVLELADQLLYQAKQAGRNCVFTEQGRWQT